MSNVLCLPSRRNKAEQAWKNKWKNVIRTEIANKFFNFWPEYYFAFYFLSELVKLAIAKKTLST